MSLIFAWTALSGFQSTETLIFAWVALSCLWLIELSFFDKVFLDCIWTYKFATMDCNLASICPRNWVKHFWAQSHFLTFAGTNFICRILALSFWHNCPRHTVATLLYHWNFCWRDFDFHEKYCLYVVYWGIEGDCPCWSVYWSTIPMWGKLCQSLYMNVLSWTNLSW